MPAHDKSKFPFSDNDPDKNSLPADWSDDDALWMLLNTYADGEATPEEIVQVEAILRARPEVSRDFAFLKLTSESVREFTEVEPPVSLSGAIFAATTHRITWKQRVGSWWTQFGRSLAPAPLRFGLVGGALAAGILAVVFWPRQGIHHPVPQDFARNTMPPIINNHLPTIVRKNEHKNIKPFVLPAPAPNPVVMPEVDKAFDPKIIVRADLPPVKPVPQLSSKPVTPDVKRPVVKNDSPKVKNDSPGGLVFSPARSGNEERHMALNTSDTGNGGTSSLGPDINDTTPEDMHIETAGMTDMGAPATHDDTPPVRVSTVSYKPGSISEAVRPAPPTLAMRANEAIRREQELQKYAGYGKDAVNNIQRGEVGFSLVGGKF